MLPEDIRVAEGGRAYRKRLTAIVYAVQMPKTFLVQTRAGQMRGEGNDYLVQAEDHTAESPHQWPVARAYFEATYEPAEETPDQTRIAYLQVESIDARGVHVCVIVDPPMHPEQLVALLGQALKRALPLSLPQPPPEAIGSALPALEAAPPDPAEA